MTIITIICLLSWNVLALGAYYFRSEVAVRSGDIGGILLCGIGVESTSVVVYDGVF